MTDEAEPPPQWIEGHKYQKGERVLFKERVYEANHLTVVRPRLTNSWRIIDEP